MSQYVYYEMASENSQDHWGKFNPEGKVVLDLGCGRHQTYTPDQHSPIYFFNRGAKRVIGVDGSDSEISYYNSLNYDKNKLAFLHAYIDSPQIVKDFIKEFNVTALKCDIEGAETNLYSLTKEDLASIEELAIEYHTMEIREDVINKINEWGFNIKFEGKFTYCHAPQMGVLFCER